MKKLILVYNANSGWHNSVIDSFHKVMSPKTYNCNLCAITFGIFSENEIWKKFRIETNIEMQFLHKNEFLKAYKTKEKYDFPMVFKSEDNEIEIVLKSQELNALKTPQDLINLIKSNI
ncbi:hypothetical protein CLV91_2978 [Maribacter vaceletii]|uniref:GTPase n=1 Tax=Maribacter vaceletii TaxID=1206816 RepID=A0A495DT06_9FLAO|nr:GTPase [Maribacter vaceletii]RKR07795.1 hypothetical protein CLV91_2978 [Maribacter vaceletii]